MHKFRIEKGLFSSGVRTYKSINGKVSIVCWSQNRCMVCGKFLDKRHFKYCSKHTVGSPEYFEINKDSYHKWNKNWREENHEYDLERRRKYFDKYIRVKDFKWLCKCGHKWNSHEDKEPLRCPSCHTRNWKIN